MMFVLSVCLSICPRAFLVVLLLLFCFFLGVFPKKNGETLKQIHTTKKIQKGERQKKKERETQKHARTHKEDIYIYTRAHARLYIYIYIYIYIQSIIHRARAGLKLARFISQSTHRERVVLDTQKTTPFFI